MHKTAPKKGSMPPGARTRTGEGTSRVKDRTRSPSSPAEPSKSMLLPLALAQFLASYDTSSMNVAISNIVADLGTTITGVQTAISVFTLTMAALMIPGSKLTDIIGRKKCFVWGISIYGLGALITSLSPVLILAGIGIILIALFFLHIRRFERKGRQPLLQSKLFRNSTSNLGLVTQNIQWLIMIGSFFVISVFLQVSRA